MYDLGIMFGEVYSKGQYVKSNIYVKDGIISNITHQELPSKETYNASGKKILPGFIDPHVHFELKGENYRSADDFYTGSISAAYGGVTTFIDFIDPISNASNLEDAYLSRRELAKKSVIDYALHVTISNPVNQVDELINEMKRLNLYSVKLFTTYSDSNRRTYDKEIIKLLRLSSTNQILIVAHIENDDLIQLSDKHTVSDLSYLRNSECETSEVLKIAGYVKKYNGNLYMVHLSSGYTLKALMEKYKDIVGSKFYVESCPHYFTFDSSVYQEEKGALYSMVPPLRSKAEVTILKNNFENIDCIGTDHCPFTKEEKQKKFLEDIPMGVGGIEQSFTIMYSLFKENAIDKMTINPAKIFNLYPKKGVIQKGSDADIVIFDDQKKQVVKKNHSLCDYSIYENVEVTGQIESTLVRGKFVIKHRKFMGGKGKYCREEK